MTRVAALACIPLALGACGRSTASAVAEDAGAPVAKAAPPAPPPPPVETPLDRIRKESTLSGAVTVAKPAMADTSDSMDKGTLLLGLWAMKSMKWPDVSVTKDETSYALVNKDPDEERGKRLCVSGTIIQIEVEKTDDGKAFHGLLHSSGGNLFRFLAVGSSGTLVGQSYARLCGVVTGKYEYANSGGGTGHAVKVVGMFDLPANKGTP